MLQNKKSRSKWNGIILHYIVVKRYLYLFLIPQALDILGLLDFCSTSYRRFGELLPASQLAHGSCLVKLSLETLQGSIDVLSFFYWYYQHGLQPPFF